MRLVRRWTLLLSGLVLMSLLAAACGAGGGGGTSGDAGGGAAEEAAGGGENAPGVSEDAIKVGVHLPLTGPASFVGQGFQLGAELAAHEINSNGGINGRNLELIFVDDEGTPEGAALAIRRLVDRENVTLILGGGTSTSTVPQIQYFEQNEEIPYYVSLASDPAVIETHHRNVFLGATVPQEDIVASIVQYIAEGAAPSSVAIMQCDQGHCQAGVPLLQEGLEAEGIEVTGVQTYNSGDTDFTGQINSILGANPDMVVVYGLAEDGGRIIPQLRQSGFQGDIVGDTSLSDPAVVEVAGEAAEGLVTFWLASTQYIDETEGAMGEWREAFNALHPDAPQGTPNLYSLMAYGDTYVVAEGLRLAGETVTREGFITALETLQDFVAGEDETWTFAAPVMMPRSFEEGDHQGNSVALPVVAREGRFGAVD
jgi:branched-chain amino acid transport system substrate-binding protein